MSQQLLSSSKFHYSGLGFENRKAKPQRMSRIDKSLLHRRSGADYRAERCLRIDPSNCNITAILLLAFALLQLASAQGKLYALSIRNFSRNASMR